ncbi:uromodulin-like 1 isoform X2 [Amphiprion ocellaris]|uniref:Uromodulin-like 1 n=1 Tax=Amphiprion ocellaris TaxID=80972 RepID=A0AAQ5YXZ3_AMPOC|nr:uromodulin-like 1 isoform X2 [Amphiprion ocellaris]
MSWMLSIWVTAALLALYKGQYTAREGNSLSPSGYHLCTYNETRIVSFLVVHKVPYTESKPCGGWLLWKTCTVTLYMLMHQTEYKTVTEQVTRCCDGYEQVGRYCALPVNRSAEFAAKPGSCPTADGLYPRSEDCELDIACPGWQKCCQGLSSSACQDPASSANYWTNGGCHLNATVTVKTDYQQLMSKDDGLLNHIRILQAMVTGALQSKVSIYYLDSWPVHPHRTATSLLIDGNCTMPLHNITSKLHLLLKHIQEVSSVTVRADVRESTTEPLLTYPPLTNTAFTPASNTTQEPPGNNFTGIFNSSENSMTTALTNTTSVPYNSSHAQLWTSSPPNTSMSSTVESLLPTTTCPPPSISSLLAANVTGTSFSVCWSTQSQTNQTHKVVLSKDSKVILSWETRQTMIEVKGLQPAMLYHVSVTPHACGSDGVTLHMSVKTDAQTLDATARLTNIQFTADLHNTSSQAYRNLTATILEELYQSFSPEMRSMVDSGQVKIEIRGFSPGSVVVNFTIIFTPSQSQNISNVSTALLHSLMNISQYTVDENNTSINDFNECASLENDCSFWATCINIWASYMCVCQDGFTDNNPERPGRACQAIATLEPTTPALTASIFSTASTTPVSQLKPSTSDPAITTIITPAIATVIITSETVSTTISTSAQDTTISTTTNPTPAPTKPTTAPTSTTVIPTTTPSIPTASSSPTATTVHAIVNTAPTTTTSTPTISAPTMTVTAPPTIVTTAPVTTISTLTATSTPVTTTATPTTAFTTPVTTSAPTTSAAPTTTTTAPAVTTTAPTTSINFTPTTSMTLTTTSTTTAIVTALVMTTAATVPTTAQTTTTTPATTTITPTTTTTKPTTTTITPTTITTTPTITLYNPTTITTMPTTTTSAIPTATTTIPTNTNTTSTTTTTTPTTITTTPTTTTNTPTTTTTPRVANNGSMRGSLSVQCRVAAITVTMAKDFLLSSKIQESALYLGMRGCGVNGGNDTHVQLTVAWNECDTRLVHNETYYTASVTLFNTMDPYTSPGGAVEVPTKLLEVPIMCTYMKSMLISADFSSMGYDMIKDVIMGLGSFQVTVQLMNGSVPLPYNYSLSSEQAVVVEVKLNTSSEQLKVVINKCWATPSRSPADTYSYAFLENSCSMNSYTKVLINGNSSTSRVSVQIFSIVNLNVIYLHCQVQICIQIGSDTCVPDCLQRTARSAKTVGTAFDSFGPIFKSDEESVEEEIGALQIVGFSCLGICLLIFLIISFVCLFYYQRNRIGHYNFSVKPKQENFTYLVFNT